MSAEELRRTARQLGIANVDAMTYEALEEAIQYQIERTVDNPDLIQHIAPFLTLRDVEQIRLLSRNWYDTTQTQFKKAKAIKCPEVWLVVQYRLHLDVEPALLSVVNSRAEGVHWLAQFAEQEYWVDTKHNIYLVMRQPTSELVKIPEIEEDIFRRFGPEEEGKAWTIYEPVLVDSRIEFHHMSIEEVDTKLDSYQDARDILGEALRIIDNQERLDRDVLRHVNRLVRDAEAVLGRIGVKAHAPDIYTRLRELEFSDRGEW